MFPSLKNLNKYKSKDVLNKNYRCFVIRSTNDDDIHKVNNLL